MGARTLKDRVWQDRNAAAGAARADTEVIGCVEHVMFFDPESGATIARLRTGEVVKGEADESGEIERGVTYRFLGCWRQHYKHGPQFQFGTYVLHHAHERGGVIRYLQQVARHVGYVTADKLWQAWGADCIRVLREEPEKVLEHGGIFATEERCYEASDDLRREGGLERTKVDLWTLFDGRGFPRTLAKRCIERWGAKAPELIRRNPFRLLVDDMPGAGWKRTDKLYLDLGGDPLALKRQTIAAWAALHDDTDGHTWHSRGVAVRAVREVAAADPRPDDAIRLGIRAGWLAARTDAAGKEWLAEGRKGQNELDLVQAVHQLQALPSAAWPDPAALDPSLTPHQRGRLAAALARPVGLLTGTPGTGKTFSAAAVIKGVLSGRGPDTVAVCAPTGKAAVRITAALQKAGIDRVQAKTIHKLLEIGRNGHNGKGWGFQRNARNPLRESFVFVDETSMLDTDLAAALFAACAHGTHVLLIGDPYQLPPVGHGAPLRDMIAAGVPNGQLTEIQRNAGMIVKACAEIKDGRRFETCEKYDPAAGRNLRFVDADTPLAAVDALKLILARFRESKRFDPVWDVQVITPLNEKSQVARVPLCDLLQGMLNPPAEGQALGGKYRPGDKLICLRNCWVQAVRLWEGRDYPEGRRIVENYTDERATGDDDGPSRGPGPAQHYLANGEIGRVEAATPALLIAEFPDPPRLVRIPLGGKKAGEGEGGGASEAARGSGDKDAGAGDFGLAYSITGHKSQGSEWRCVIVMVDDGAGFVAGREWVYTAISRARELCVMIGKRPTVDRQCKRVVLGKRKTFLRELLAGEIEP